MKPAGRGAPTKSSSLTTSKSSHSDCANKKSSPAVKQDTPVKTGMHGFAIVNIAIIGLSCYSFRDKPRLKPVVLMSIVFQAYLTRDKPIDLLGFHT